MKEGNSQLVWNNNKSNSINCNQPFFCHCHHRHHHCQATVSVAYLMWLSPGIGRQFGFYIFYVRWAYDFVKLFSHKKNSSIWLSAAFAVVLLTNSSSKWKFVCTADWWINIGDHLFKARVKARTSWFIETIFTTAWVSYTTSCDAWLLFISFQYNTRICKYDEGWVLIKGNDIFSYNSIRTFLIFHRYNYFSLSQK